MAAVFDVAAYVLRKQGAMTAMKLQKLVYYAQAWSLVWDERPLFRARIEAWANGPVVPYLYRAHKGKFKVSRKDFPRGNPKGLTPEEKDTLDAILKYYGKRCSQWLSEVTRHEAPWSNARKGLGAGERGQREITPAAMAEFYGSL